MAVAVVSHGDGGVPKALLNDLGGKAPVYAPARVEMPEDVHTCIFGPDGLSNR